MEKPNIWWELINTPRKAACWAVLVVAGLVINGLPFFTLELTTYQRFVEYWYVYLPLVIAMIAAIKLYPKT